MASSVDFSFALWNQMKAYAAEYVSEDRPLPLDAAAVGWLRTELRKRLPSAPDVAADFYVRELSEMVERGRLHATQ